MPMPRFLARLLHRAPAPPGAAAMDRGYVSEFTRFMDDFLKHHPEELDTQWTGWRIYWDKQVDLKEEAKARSDEVPQDGYGFYNSAWTRADYRDAHPGTRH